MMTHKAHQKNTMTQYVSFAVRDRLGRQIGANITTYECDFAPQPDGLRDWGYDIPPGHYFAFEPHAARNRQDYGAAQPTRYFTTAQQRGDAIAAYLKGAQKRYKLGHLHA